ncbi:MAG: lipoate--protein ligase family protein [Candidatus Thorarchaeota archaeon]|jgi:lipoate-protein ligase A
MSWRLLEDSENDIHRNLAIEEALASVNSESQAKVNTLRLWRATDAVVIGRFQCVHKEADIDYCNQNGIAIARRFTGGGAVFHDLGNLNFTLCMDQKESYVAKTLPTLYRNFVGAVARGLNDIGAPVYFDKERSCIRIGGKKITGTAGWIKRGVSFIHGTLLINSDLKHLKRSLEPPSDQPQYIRDKRRIRCMESKRDIVTSLAEALFEPPSDKEIKAAIIESIQVFTGESMVGGNLSKEEQDTAHALYQSRYSQSEWNLGTLHPDYNSR